MILRFISIQQLIVLCSIITTIQAAPVILYKRGETGQGQSVPFWISVVAVVSILVAIILGVVIIYCIKTRRKQRRYREQQHSRHDQLCTPITNKNNIKKNSKISKQINDNDNDSLDCLHHSQQHMNSNHTDRTGKSDSNCTIVHETSDEELESSKRNRLSILFFGQPPSPPNRQQQIVKENKMEEKSLSNAVNDDESDKEQLQQQEGAGKQFLKNEKKKRNINNGTWTSAAFASLGRKSVASVQWVGFRASMDRQPQQNTGLFVVNNNNNNNSYYYPNNNNSNNSSSTDHLAQYNQQQHQQQDQIFRY